MLKSRQRNEKHVSLYYELVDQRLLHIGFADLRSPIASLERDASELTNLTHCKITPLKTTFGGTCRLAV